MYREVQENKNKTTATILMGKSLVNKRKTILGMAHLINQLPSSIPDYGLITLLYQDEMGGLEVRGVNNTWVAANPIKDSILINAGDFLEVYTNGRLPATVHRVVVPKEEIRRKTSRQSIVFFVHPDHETTISPLPMFLGANNDKNVAIVEKRGIFTSTKEFTKGYQPVNSLEHLNRRLAATYQF